LAHDYGRIDIYTAHGANVIRVFVALAPLILAMLFYKKLKSVNKDINIIINSALIAAIFMIASTNYWIFARISSYFNVAIHLLIPELAKLFNRKGKKLFYVIVICLYFLYMLALLPNESSLLPYRTILFMGMRKNDISCISCI
jgi:transmembrane protein EpsG